MPGRGPVPKPPAQRRTRHKPQLGEMVATPGVGWQHGPIPVPPDGLMPASLAAWETWMASWVAAHWQPMDLPGLRKVVLLYDATERGELHRSGELRMSMDVYGISPKGQQDRRWAAPKVDDVPVKTETPAATDPRFARLRAV